MNRTRDDVISIRHEHARDAGPIHELTDRAFRPMAFSDGSEPAVIDRLRARGELELSLIAEIERAIVGHVAFSIAGIGDSNEAGWYALGPVAVDPPLQRTGIGTALIEEGLSRLRASGARGIVLIGDPAYYRRFGFVSDGRLHYEDLDDVFVQWLAFDEPPPSGELRFADAFTS